MPAHRTRQDRLADLQDARDERESELRIGFMQRIIELQQRCEIQAALLRESGMVAGSLAERLAERGENVQAERDLIRWHREQAAQAGKDSEL